MARNLDAFTEVAAAEARPLLRDRFLLDVQAGDPEDFSLAAGDNPHFVTRSATC